VTQTRESATALKVVSITSEDPFYINRFFAELFRILPGHPVEMLAIVKLKPFNAPSWWMIAKRMVNFYGIRDFCRMGLRYLLKRLRNPSLTALAARHGVRVFSVRDINSTEFLNHLAEMKPDVIVSVAASQIFRQRLLNLPPRGCWNVHGGCLPRYRGMMPAFWTLLHGERTGAITVHRMNSRLDDGEILLQRMYPIESGESLDHVISHSKTLGAGVLLDALEMLYRGDYTLLPNDRAEATCFTFPTRGDVRRFREKGLRLL